MSDEPKHMTITFDCRGLFPTIFFGVIFGQLAWYVAEETIDYLRYGNGECRAGPVIVEPPIPQFHPAIDGPLANLNPIGKTQK